MVRVRVRVEVRVRIMVSVACQNRRYRPEEGRNTPYTTATYLAIFAVHPAVEHYIISCPHLTHILMVLRLTEGGLEGLEED